MSVQLYNYALAEKIMVRLRAMGYAEYLLIKNYHGICLRCGNVSSPITGAPPEYREIAALRECELLMHHAEEGEARKEADRRWRESLSSGFSGLSFARVGHQGQAPKKQSFLYKRFIGSPEEQSIIDAEYRSDPLHFNLRLLREVVLKIVLPLGVFGYIGASIIESISVAPF